MFKLRSSSIRSSFLIRSALLLPVLAGSLLPSFSAQAYLVDRGAGLIYDTDTNLTWLQDTQLGGKRSWVKSVVWAEDLEYQDSIRKKTWTDWRLPSALERDGSAPCDYYWPTASAGCKENSVGYFISSSEIADVRIKSAQSKNEITFSGFRNGFYWTSTLLSVEALGPQYNSLSDQFLYDVLSGLAGTDYWEWSDPVKSAAVQFFRDLPEWTELGTGPGERNELQVYGWQYWSSLHSLGGYPELWGGVQSDVHRAENIVGLYSPWVVREGDVAVPGPSTYVLFGLGLIGTVMLRRGQSKKPKN